MDAEAETWERAVLLLEPTSDTLQHFHRAGSGEFMLLISLLYHLAGMVSHAPTLQSFVASNPPF